MSFSISAHLSPTPSDREAIVDAIARCVCGLDTADRALFQSAFTADAVFELNGTLLRGLEDITASCFDIVSKLDTTHMTSNVRTTFAEGGRAATTTATGVAHHYRAGRGLDMEQGGHTERLVVGSLYSIDFVKVDGGQDGEVEAPIWKAKTWRLKSVWTQGDWAIMGALPAAFAHAHGIQALNKSVATRYFIPTAEHAGNWRVTPPRQAATIIMWEPHPEQQFHLRLHRAQSVVLTNAELVEVRAAQRTFEGAYMRTALGQFSFSLVVLKIFTHEFYPIGALFAVYGTAILLVAVYRRYEGQRQFFTKESADGLLTRKFRTSGDTVTLLTILSLLAYATLVVLTLLLTRD